MPPQAEALTAPSTTTATTVPVTVAHGDGIGPEIMEATLRVLQAADAPLEFQAIDIGERAYLDGHTSGIPPEAWDVIRSNPAFARHDFNFLLRVRVIELDGGKPLTRALLQVL